MAKADIRVLTDMEAAILTVVRDDSPLHGFEAGRRALALLGRAFDPTAAYRPLHRLERSGLVSAFFESEDEARTHKGPRRRYYTINPVAANAALETYRHQRVTTTSALAKGWSPS